MKLGLVCSILLVMVACSPALAPAPDPSVVLEELFQADRDFAKAAQDSSISQAFGAFAAAEAVVYPQGSDPVRGPAAIQAAYRTLDQARLLWDPDAGHAAPAGDFGYTTGRFRVEDAAGNIVSTGRYLTVWARQADGSWKFVADLGNTDATQETEQASGDEPVGGN